MKSSGELKAHWEKIHSEKSRDVSWWQNPEELWIEDFSELDLGKDSPIIDIGSGPSLLLKKLIELGFINLTALDISSQALERLKSNLGDLSAKVNFVHSDILDFAGKDSIKVWHDRAVLHFLADPIDQARYSAVINSAVQSGGYALISTFALDGPDSCSGLPVVRHDSQSIGKILGNEFELMWEKPRIHRTPWESSQAFITTLFKKK